MNAAEEKRFGELERDVRELKSLLDDLPVRDGQGGGGGSGNILYVKADTKLNLGTPLQFAIGEVTDAGNDQGLWVWDSFAVTAQTNSSWIPFNAWAQEAV